MTDRNEQARERLVKAAMDAEWACWEANGHLQPPIEVSVPAILDALLAHPDDLLTALGGARAETIEWWILTDQQVWRFPRVLEREDDR